MTGISKNFVKFSSLLAVVAMFLGLMVTGCSEGDSTPAHVDYDADSASLDIIVGVADPVAKGFDVDANVNTLAMRLYDAAGERVGEAVTFGETAAEGVEAWTVLDDGALLMSTTVAPENVEKVAALIVAAFDKDNNLLGVYADDALTVAAGTKTTADFTAKDAPAFQTTDELLNDASLTLTSDPEAVEGVVSIAVGDIATISATAEKQLAENLVVVMDIPADYLNLTADSADVKCDGNTVEGINVTTEDVVVTGTTTNGNVTLTGTINVKVTDAEPAVVNAIKIVAAGSSLPATDEEWEIIKQTQEFPAPATEMTYNVATLAQFVDANGKYSYDFVTGAAYESNDPTYCPITPEGELTVKAGIPAGNYTVTATYEGKTVVFTTTII